MRKIFLSVLALVASSVLSGGQQAAANDNVRIASPWPAQNTIITMLGYGDNIVGTSIVAKRIPLFRQSLPHINVVPVISVNSGHEINPEQIISLGTQILFVPENTMVPRQEVLKQTGVRVLALKGNSMDALRERVLKTGEVLGTDAQQKAQSYEQYFKRNIGLVASRLKGLPQTQRIRVYHSMGSPLKTTGRPSLNQDWMDLAGANNIAETWFSQGKNASGEVALEQIVSKDPQVIVAMNKRDTDEIRTSAQWKSIDAVIHNRVVVNPKGMFWWCRETSEEALQFLWLAKTLYPERFFDIDMMKETREFYHTFLGLKLTDVQINNILYPPD